MQVGLPCIGDCLVCFALLHQAEQLAVLQMRAMSLAFPPDEAARYFFARLFSMPMAAADYYGSTRAPNFSTIGSTQHGLAPRWSRRSIRLGPIRTRPTIRLLKPSTFCAGAAASGTASDRKNLRGKKILARPCLPTHVACAATRTAAIATCARRHRSRAVQQRCAEIKLRQLELTDYDALRQLLICQFQLPQSNCPAIILTDILSTNVTDTCTIGCCRSGCRSRGLD